MSSELISVLTCPAKKKCYFSFQAHASDAVSSSPVTHKNESSDVGENNELKEKK